VADMMSTLRGILGEGADEKIKNAMEILNRGEFLSEGKQGEVKEEPKSSDLQVGAGNTGLNLTPESLQMISQIKDMFDQISTTNDSRSELLRSLRPFMRSERQRSIDRAIRLINIGRFSGLIRK